MSDGVDPKRFEEFKPDYRDIEIRTLERRIDAEQLRRVAEHWPIDLQLQLLASAVAVLSLKDMTSDERRFAETDAIDLKAFLACSTKHRLAARSFKRAIREPGVDLKAIDPKAEHWWSYE